MEQAAFNSVPSDLTVQEWSCLHAELKWIYDRQVLPVHRNRRVDKTQGYWAWFVREGKARVKTASGQVYEAGPGMWLLPPAEKLWQYFSDNTRLLSVHFYCQWPSGDGVIARNQGLIFEGKKYPRLERKGKQLERVVSRQFPNADARYSRGVLDYGTFLYFQTLFLQWLALWFNVWREHGGCLTRLTNSDDRLVRVVRHLRNAPLNEGLPQQRLCQEIGLGEAHLNRLFLKEFGLTIPKFWEQRRIETARQFLQSGNMPVKEVAYHLGFRSNTYFTSWFRRATGKRPSDYRRQQLSTLV